MNYTFYAKTLKDYTQIAKELIIIFEKNEKVGFFGEMGVGKTTLIKAICKALGINELVSSPTFSVVNQYHNEESSIIVFHFDFYRIDKEEELFDLGLEEYLEGNSYCFMEWPEKSHGFWQEEFVKVCIERENDYRIIKVVKA